MNHVDALNLQNKLFVWHYWQEMNRSGNENLFFQSLHPDVTWHGFQPLRRLNGSAEIWSRFWQPLSKAIPDLLRRPYLFIGGHFEGGDWVAGTGDFIGTFANDWIIEETVIPASGSSVHFRFGEFCRVEGSKIVEIRLIIDLPDLMRQAGINLFPASYGRDLWVPGPRTAEAVLLNTQDSAESARTLALVEEMIFGGLNRYDGQDQASQGLERFWHPHMVWHGPFGIGSAYGLEAFKTKAQGPIVRAFPDRKGVGHRARLAEGHFAASTGWPSLAGTHRGEILGWAPTERKVGWNIMDFWRREGVLLRENWVLIDLVDAARQAGVDLLAAQKQGISRR